METLFINTEYSETNEPHQFRLTLAEKLNLKDPNKNMALAKKQNCLKIKTGCKLKLLSPETMKLLVSTDVDQDKDADQDKDGEDVPKLESDEVLLMHCSLVNNNYQQSFKVLYTFVPNYKQFGRLINIAPHLLAMLNTTNTEFSSIEVWFTDQISKELEIEDIVNMTNNWVVL